MLDWALRGIAVLLAAGVIIGALATSRRRKALKELERGLDCLVAGRPLRPMRLGFLGRLGAVSRTFNELAPRIEARLSTLEGDRQLMGAVLGGMTEGVIAVDSRRRLLFANDAASRLFGLSAGSVGRLVAELIRSPKVQEAVDATLANPTSYRVEIDVAGPETRPLGTSRSLAVQGTPLPGNPAPGAVLVFHDVTDLRRLERMRQDFVANASHELKTPLAAIKAYTETLIDGALHDDEVNVRFLEQIDEQAERLNRLIQDLLSLARLEAGQDVFQYAPMKLAPVVRKIVESHRSRAEACERIYILEPFEGDPWIRADEEALRQILDNLIDNAIKYTSEGGRVMISCRAAADLVVLSVSDNGVGIPRDDLPRVFERFYRVDKARSRELGGTGLGLSIVKHLVQSLGGKVAVESRPGQGSTFRVALPQIRQGDLGLFES